MAARVTTSRMLRHHSPKNIWGITTLNLNAGDEKNCNIDCSSTTTSAELISW
jgi:hypothetical protein